jgi:hypothetical protein
MKVDGRWEHAFKPRAQQKRELAEEHNLEYQAREIEERSLQAIRLEMIALRSGSAQNVGPRGLHKPDPTNAKRAVIGLPDYAHLKQVWPVVEQ